MKKNLNDLADLNAKIISENTKFDKISTKFFQIMLYLYFFEVRT
jgi:hypothetical protein